MFCPYCGQEYKRLSQHLIQGEGKQAKDLIKDIFTKEIAGDLDFEFRSREEKVRNNIEQRIRQTRKAITDRQNEMRESIQKKINQMR